MIKGGRLAVRGDIDDDRPGLRPVRAARVHTRARFLDHRCARLAGMEKPQHEPLPGLWLLLAYGVFFRRQP